MNFSAFVKFLCFSAGASDTKHVVQTPPVILKKPDESVDSEIRCSHSIQDYEVILWYKQDKHKALKLLGYLNMKITNPEDDVKGKISFDGDGRQQSSLTVSDLHLNDSAAFFCAASRHSAADSTKSLQKPSFICLTHRPDIQTPEHLQTDTSSTNTLKLLSLKTFIPPD